MAMQILNGVRKKRKYASKSRTEIDEVSYRKAIQLSELVKDFFDYIDNNLKSITQKIENLYEGMSQLDSSVHLFIGLTQKELMSIFRSIYHGSSRSVLCEVQEFFPGKSSQRMVCLCVLVLLATEIAKEQVRTFIPKKQIIWRQIYKWVVAEFPK